MIPSTDSRPVEEMVKAIISMRALGIRSRELCNHFLREVLDTHPRFFSTWCVWEPGAFDGRDPAFRNATGHDSSGRFIPSWHREGDRLELWPVIGYQEPGYGDWYWVPKRKCQPCAMDEPYCYPIGGRPRWITSEAAPIIENGRCIGVIGIDFPAPQGPGGCDIAKPIVRVLSRNTAGDKLRLLTSREREVHFWLSQGKTNDEIGIILGISTHTVKNHLEHVFQKLGVENRYAAALTGIEPPASTSPLEG